MPLPSNTEDLGTTPPAAESAFQMRLRERARVMRGLFHELYDGHPEAEARFLEMTAILERNHRQRSPELVARDEVKSAQGHWFLSNRLAGMSLYVDRFCGSLMELSDRLDYFSELGVNLLHLMPIFESPEGESDGGYAVSDFRRVEPRFGTDADLQTLQKEMQSRDMYLMLDIVFNHTSHRHEWAKRARLGDEKYQGYYHMYPDRVMPDRFEAAMPEVFPEAAPGNFTYVPECGRWVMTVFHDYQWDLNYTNPAVFNEMLDNVLFQANLGVDILRIDAPAFLWKEPGTSCQNLPKAHTILRLLKQCVATAAPGMALLGEAIVAPAEVMRYFGTDRFEGHECDFAYNATHMALQWDALATADTRVMLSAQPLLLQKPYGTSWINYTRCHDDIGLGYEDESIRSAGYDPFAHKRYIKDYYSGAHPGSPATGALFSVNPKTNDARISGTLASLCGLESALRSSDQEGRERALRKIVLMQAHSFFLGGLPMLFYGDEVGYTNDHSYLDDPGKSYDNRWMHRPVIDWDKNALRLTPGTTEHRVFSDTRRLLSLRRSLDMVADLRNLHWFDPHNIHVAGYLREHDGRRLFCVFNFGGDTAHITWYAFKQHGRIPQTLLDHWTGTTHRIGEDHEHLVLEPYTFMLLEESND